MNLLASILKPLTRLLLLLLIVVLGGGGAVAPVISMTGLDMESRDAEDGEEKEKEATEVREALRHEQLPRGAAYAPALARAVSTTRPDLRAAQPNGLVPDVWTVPRRC